MREERYHFLEKKNYFKKIYLDEVLFSRYSSKGNDYYNPNTVVASTTI